MTDDDWKPFPSCRALNSFGCLYPSACKAGERDPSQDRCRYGEAGVIDFGRRAADLFWSRIGNDEGKRAAHNAVMSDVMANRLYQLSLTIIAELLEKIDDR